MRVIVPLGIVMAFIIIAITGLSLIFGRSDGNTSGDSKLPEEPHDLQDGGPHNPLG